MKIESKVFLILFTIGSLALLAGSWFHVIPFSITEDLGFITGALTVYVEEYARGLLDFKDGRCDYEDIEKIAYGHRASERALARQANKILFSDTDLLTTTIWSNALFGTCPEWIYEAAEEITYDLYLVTDIDVPWVDDNQRFFSEEKQRQDFLERCLQALEQRNRPYIMLSGTWEQRLSKAISAVEAILHPEKIRQK